MRRSIAIALSIMVATLASATAAFAAGGPQPPAMVQPSMRHFTGTYPLNMNLMRDFSRPGNFYVLTVSLAYNSAIKKIAPWVEFNAGNPPAWTSAPLVDTPFYYYTTYPDGTSVPRAKAWFVGC
jgi:hypothetical protein